MNALHQLKGAVAGCDVEMSLLRAQMAQVARERRRAIAEARQTMTVAEIAEALEVSPQAVYKALRR